MSWFLSDLVIVSIGSYKMSIIKNHKKKLLLFSLIFVVLFCGGYILTRSLSFATTMVVIYSILFFLNWAVVKKNNNQKNPLNVYSDIRNVDYLVIGEYCDVGKIIPGGKTCVRILAPRRSYEASYQILRHTHSILKEEGGTVIICAEKMERKYSVFDIPFFHPITIKKLNLERLKTMSYAPLLFSPVNALRFLIGMGG